MLHLGLFIFLGLCFSGGESGVPLQLQIDVQDTTSPNSVPLVSAACQVKVFKVVYIKGGEATSPGPLTYELPQNLVSQLLRPLVVHIN